MQSGNTRIAKAIIAYDSLYLTSNFIVFIALYALLIKDGYASFFIKLKVQGIYRLGSEKNGR